MDDCDRRVPGDRVDPFRQKHNKPAAWLTGIAEGVPTSTRLLLIFQFLVNLSVFGSLPLLAAFLDMERHLDASSVASVLTMSLLASRLLPLVLGASTDRFSSRVLTTLGLLCRAAGFVGFAYARSLPGLLTWACVSGLGAALYETTAYSIFGSLDGAVRPKVFALNNLALNLGALIGPALLFVVPNTNGALPFLVSGAVFAALALIAPWIAGRSTHDAGAAHPLRGVLVAFGDRRFRRLCWALVPFWIVYTQIYVFIPLTFSHGAHGYNGVRPFYITNALIGIATAWLGMGWFQRTNWRSMMVIGHVALCGCFAMAALLFVRDRGADASLVILVVIAIVFTFGESLILPASNIALADLTTHGNAGSYFGASAISWAIGGMLGNFIGSVAAGWKTLAPGWFLFMGIALVGLLTFCRQRPK
ncbi:MULTISPECIES: MFS transporter [Burkholderia]|uniref:MFS transporter n=1 Tax=Burkholderia contaminans TaxID=488447 RepID=A0A2S5E468_9BURK|nr:MULTISPECIES: MFS transporter [Burkholderia]EKS9795897.1 MFS transporter [Burkholderia cepacia]EKS9806677.1 MFS transporter [Burkholderia cepacia]EKS9814146.1 MFS transporter [Burkholderia cepacia]EKS9819221.1 MFS transporter [Burkholderia cepacia]EKS9827023.1 MFS transporter [Burkholderia cepacia]